MTKFIFLFLAMFCFKNALFAQKTFEITVKLDSSINPKKIHYQYDNGKNTTFLPDTFGSSRNVVIKGTYYSQLLNFTVGYSDSAKKYFYNDFFLTEKPAAVEFYYKPNDDAELKYKFARNVSRVYDTTNNNILRELWAFTKKEDTTFSNFLTQNKLEIGRNDTVRRVFLKLYKATIIHTMQFLSKYPDDYFSFWYFRNQVSQLPNGFLNNDTTLLEKQFAYLKAVYPPKFTESVEGKALIQLFEGRLNPLKKREPAPLFSFTTLDGKKLKLADLKGKYVLLDFWATWCGPCMAEIPFIKVIRKKYPSEKLVIIGISQDRDRKKWQEAIKNEAMGWLHYYDTNADIAHLYGINWFPTLVLIDKTGKIIYASDNKTDDKDMLPDILSLTGM
jgi:thiol-disulfide isomerase/thioredoxin